MEKFKKAVSVILALIITASMLTVNIFAADVEEEDTVIVYGDVSKDGKVSLADAFMVLASKIGFISLDETQKFYGDVDADGTVGFSDMWLIVRYSFGWVGAFPVEKAVWLEGEKTADTHFLDACYQYDKETGLYEFYINMNIILPNEDGIYLRAEIYNKGNKQRLNCHMKYNNYSIITTMLFDGEKYYILLPLTRTYAEVDTGDTEGYFEEDIYFEDESIDFAELSYVGSTKNTLGGIDYICEKYTLDDVYYNFWFTTSGKAVRMESLGDTDVGTSVMIINAFSPNVDDSVFTIPSNYTKVEFDELFEDMEILQ